MKQSNTLPFALLALVASLSIMLQTSCTFDDCTATITYSQFDPVYMTRAQLNESVVAEPARPLERPHKVYVYGQYLLIGEQNLGIHVYDNINPSAPVALSFISIPGNNDMAVMNGFLYADQVSDLIVLSLSNPASAELISRQQDFFDHWCTGCHFHDAQGYLAYFREREVTEIVDCHGAGPRRGSLATFDSQSGNPAPTGGVNSQSGTGGSMARFTLLNGHLYAVDHTKLYTVSINDPWAPVMMNETQLGWGIETVYPFKDKLFIGSNTGMFIYDVSQPTNPQYLSSFEHALACDPVVANDDRAYVTLRTGNICPNGANQLDVLDISNILQPVLLKSYPMQNPHGLAIRDNTLYVCEGRHGLKIFDASEDMTIDKNRLAYLKDRHAYDVISLSADHLLLTGDDGIYQYNVSNPKDPKRLSHIPVVNP